MTIQTPIKRKPTAGRLQPFFAIGYLFAAFSLPALSHAADNPGAHEHGHARLQIAVENNSIDLIFTSPAYNLAGFEHEARSDEEKNRLAEISQWLDTTPLVNTEAADCRITGATVELGGQSGKEDHDHHDHGGDHEESTHREYDVSQQLECDDTGARMTLTSALMEKFGNLEELAVEWVSPSGQGSARLARTNRAFTVSK
ncbi:ZrgA family zinc uptake protein [Marinobacter orientalis]|uniref:DUF2796 domain-containing protein n=1 Tax=Marinobacter orientalis TaxID=1928859 RepID=A0A7Y0NJI1_9GAMM|nr:DUF2796 domain-containing protein [Marinobacter orientalis]NMT62343.1 DUF2796 domain-containing protein [Marinobacter orientalis]TGX51049.1 DUF2796 domain-containing protein [Marinobacter orientalis]